MREHAPDERMDALVERVRAFDDCPHARIAAMVESLLTPAQWDALEAMAARREDRQEGRESA
ncbi:hypothetical protein KBTX_02471 [wastewater metagenome]|uniref:Uncharacterized protein n=2 Tax=unclassified sequences TaxID=12908 RepID=A0A5B8RBW7_9ZZZZ|nr:hypothetical protein [Arhodomonas sp. KWT]QEA06141.1 hypothetical protein KBTEX_02471 [uncultured organism]